MRGFRSKSRIWSAAITKLDAIGCPKTKSPFPSKVGYHLMAALAQIDAALDGE